MSSIGSVSVDFIAETKGFVDGLRVVSTETAKTMAGVSTSMGRASDASGKLGDANEEAAKQASKAWKGSTEQLGKFEDKLSDTTDTAKTLADSILQIGGSLALGSVIKEASQAAREYENFAMQMGVLLGDAELATKTIAELNKYSLDTPFSPKQVQTAGRALLSFGITTDKLIPSLKTLGDVALGTGKDFNELAILFGKAKVSGVLMAEDLNQFTEAGIPILEQLAINLGVAASDVKKLGSESKITFNDLVKALESTEGPMSKYVGMTSEASKTTDGLLSSLEGNVEEFKKSIGEVYNSVLKPMVETLLEISNGIIAWAKENPALAKTIVEVTAALIAMSAAILGTAGLVSAFSLVSGAIKSMQASLIAFSAAQTATANAAVINWAKILGPFMVAGAVVFALTFTANFIERRRIEREETSRTIGTGAALLSTEQQRKELIPLLQEYNKQIDALKKGFEQVSKTGGDFDDKLKDQRESLNNVVNRIESLGGNLPALANELRIGSIEMDNLRRSSVNAASALTAISPEKTKDNVKKMGDSLKGSADGAKELSQELAQLKAQYAINNREIIAITESNKQLNEEAKDYINTNKLALDKELNSIDITKKKNQGIKEQVELVKRNIEAQRGYINVIGERNKKEISIAEALDKKISKWSNESTKMQQSTDILQSASGSMMSIVESIPLIGPLIKAAVDLTASFATEYINGIQQMRNASVEFQKSQAQFVKTILNNNIQSIRATYSQMQKEQEQALESTVNAQQELIDESLKKIKEYNDEKERLIRQSNLAIDESNRQAYENAIRLIDAENKARIAAIYATAGDRTQAIIIEQEIIQSGEEQKQQLLEYYANKTEEDKKQSEENIINTTDDRIKSEESLIAQYQANIEAAQESHQGKMEEIAKKMAMAEYNAGKKGFLIDKAQRLIEYKLQAQQAWASYNVGVVNALASGNLAQAIAMRAFGLPALQLSLASINMASMATIAEEYPPPPVFGEGGIVGGELHSNGGTPIMAERGEFIINRKASEQNFELLSKINNGDTINNSSPMNLYVTNNISGLNDIDAIADQIGSSIMQRVKAANYGYL